MKPKIHFDVIAKFFSVLRLKGWYSKEEDSELKLESVDCRSGILSAFQFRVSGQPAGVMIPAESFEIMILLTEDRFPGDLSLTFQFEGQAVELGAEELKEFRSSYQDLDRLSTKFFSHLPVGGRILDIGGRARSGLSRKDVLSDFNVDVLDIIDDEGVDFVADIHDMSSVVGRESYDAVLSVWVFEHLIMPWKAALEINRVLKQGGYAYIQTHQAVGMHDMPWDYYRYSDTAWKGLFNEFTGFEIVGTVLERPHFLIPQLYEERYRDAEQSAGFEVSAVLVRKTGDARVDWPVAAADVTEDTYPDVPDANEPGWSLGPGAGKNTEDVPGGEMFSGEKAPLSVLVLTHNRGAVPQVRLLSPLRELSRRKLLSYRVIVIADGGTVTDKDFVNVDLVVFQRIDHENFLKILHYVRGRGIPTVYEIDDNLLEIPPDNPNHAHYSSPRIKKIISEFLASVNHVTVSTPALRESFMKYNPAVTVLPNQIDEEFFRHRAHRFSGSRIRIGYAGTVTHKKDFQQVIPALRKIQEEFPDRVQLVFMNYLPEEFAGDDRVEYIAGADTLAGYARRLDGASLDIGLAPLHFNEFNRGKSEVKFLEYAALHIAGIYSRFTPYENTVRDGETGLLVSTEDPEEWAEKIRMLIQNPDLLERIRENAARYVLSQRTVASRAMDWLRCYEGLRQDRHAKVSIIIPVWNQPEYTRNCIESVYRHTPEDVFQLYVVDNGSDTETASWLEIASRTRDKFTLIRNEENLGFARANNQAAMMSASPYLLLLNNDTEVRDGWLESLLAIADNDDDVLAVGSKLLHPDGTVQHAGVALVENRMSGAGLEAWHVDYGKQDGPTTSQIREFQALTAACLLIRRTAFDEAGAFDEEFINGYEDVDLCMRLRKLGGRLIYQPESVVTHFESKSGPLRFAREKENLLRFQKKWTGQALPDFSIQEDGHQQLSDNSVIKLYHPRNPDAKPEKRSSGRSIVIVTYKSAETIERCLLSVFRTLGFYDEIIVVDNAGGDDTVSIVKKIFEGRERCRLIQNPRNMGFADATNVGIRVSSGEYIVLLNPDTLVSHEWLDRLQFHFETDSLVAAVGPLSNYAAALQNIDRHTKKDISHLKNVDEITEKYYSWYREEALETPLLTGFCLMARYDRLKEIGFLDPQLFLGNDDLDMSWRLRLKGYTLKVARDVFVYHEGQHSFRKTGSKRTAKLVQESSDLLYLKLVRHYGENGVPKPDTLWGIDWFHPRNARYNAEAGLFAHEAQLPADAAGNDPLVSIIMLTWNALEYTQRAVDSIFAATQHPFELVCVDNGSEDGTKKYLRELARAHSNVMIVDNSRNLGFAKGNNQGAEKARGKYLLFLNNDVLVHDGWLDSMLALLTRDEGIGMVGPLTNFISGAQMIADVPYTDEQGYHDYAAKLSQQFLGKFSPRRRLAGFALLIRTSLFQSLNGFDEQFGSGNFEDDDLCLRIRKEGYALMVDESVIIHHFGSRTFQVNQIDYSGSLKSRGELFHKKWPDVDMEELLERTGTLTESHQARIETASQALLESRFEDAKSIFESILRENPLDSAALYGMALTWKLKEQPDEALFCLRKLLAQYPDHADAYNQSGIIAFESQDYENARFLFLTAVEKDLSHLDARRNLAEVLLVLEEYEEAIRLFLQIRDTHPEDITTHVRLFEIYRDAGAADQARETLNILKKLNPDRIMIADLEKSLEPGS